MNEKMKPIGFAYRDSNGTTLIGNFDTSSEEAIPGLERYERLPLYSQSQVKEMIDAVISDIQRGSYLGTTRKGDEIYRINTQTAIDKIIWNAAKYGIKLD